MDHGEIQKTPRKDSLPDKSPVRPKSAGATERSPHHRPSKKFTKLLLRLHKNIKILPLHLLGLARRLGTWIWPAGLYFVYSVPSLLLLLLMLALYWPYRTVIENLYSLHMELTGSIFVGLVVLASFGGLKSIQRSGLIAFLHGESDENDLVATLVTVAGIFFALVMAVIATGVWDNFKTVSETVAHEAQSADSLYRDFESYRATDREHFQGLLKQYIGQVVDFDWKSQRRGIDPGPNAGLDALMREVLAFKPESNAERLLHPDTVAEVSRLQAYRHARRHAVTLSLPPVLWLVVFAGAGLSISMVYTLRTESARLHVLLVCALGAIVGLVLFLVLAMDHPLWGELSVPKDPFENLLREWH